MTTDNAPGVSQWGSLASWGQRVGATLIDALVGIALSAAVYLLAFLAGVVSDVLGSLLLLLGQLVLLGYAYVLLGMLEGTTGQSPGKAIMGLKVVSDTSGQTIGAGQGIVRRITHFLDSLICFIGYLLPLFDPKRQTIADKLMTTVVLAGQPARTFGPDLFVPPGLGTSSPDTV